MNKTWLKKVSELEEACQGVLAVPVPKEDREKIYALTKKTIEELKKKNKN